MKKLLNKKGFTLIELIVVIAILAILAMILIPSLTGYIKKATDAKDAANCRSLYTKYQLDIAVAPSGTTVTIPATEGGFGTIAALPLNEAPAGSSLTDFTCTVSGTGGKSYGLLAKTGNLANFAVSP